MPKHLPGAALALALSLAGCASSPETSTEPVHSRPDAPIGSNIPRRGPPPPSSPIDPALQSPVLR
jgi:hypothetical protein